MDQPPTQVDLEHTGKEAWKAPWEEYLTGNEAGNGVAKHDNTTKNTPGQKKVDNGARAKPGSPKPLSLNVARIAPQSQEKMLWSMPGNCQACQKTKKLPRSMAPQLECGHLLRLHREGTLYNKDWTEMRREGRLCPKKFPRRQSIMTPNQPMEHPQR